MEDVTPSTMRRDIVSAYVASGAKIVSWMIVAAWLYRAEQLQYAIFALVRGTVGLLNYTVLGVGPAMIQMIAHDRAERGSSTQPVAEAPTILPDGQPLPLSYAPGRYDRDLKDPDPALRAYSNAVLVVGTAALIALFLIFAYAAAFPMLHPVPWKIRDDVGLIVLMMGIGTVLRLVSDVPGAVLQSSEKISKDNWCLAWGELVWILSSIWCARSRNHSAAEAAAIAFAFSSTFILIARLRLCVAQLGRALPDRNVVSDAAVGELLGFGVMVTIAQLADFLYAPTDFILISRLINTETIAVYAPAVQIDAGLLVIVGAIASVLLPRAARAHAGGELDRLRQYYVRGSLLSAALLLGATLLTWILSPWIFRFWLGKDVLATRAILPLILVHTVVGGSSAVGRSILLGMGKVKPFTISVLIAGVSNVILSYVFVRYFNLGLRGIVLATIIAVVGRCAIWMPWYVLRTLRSESSLRIG